MISKAVTIADTRGLLRYLPTVQAPVPEYLFIATDNARCGKADILINEGDHVYEGQVIGIRHAGFFDQPIHATCSGTFEGYEKHYHRSGKQVNFIKIHNDGKDEWDPSIQPRTDEEVSKLTREDLVQILQQWSSVGLGGSSFPTFVKLKGEHKINTILVNGVECEPYITADHRLMMENPEDIIRGMLLLEQVYQCKDARLCIKSKHKDLIMLYEEVLRRYPDMGISVCPVGNFYPQGWEIAMIKSATGIEIPTGHLPGEYGIANFNVTTVAGIYQAAKYNHPVNERLITVTGDGIKYPTNFKVRVGTPIKPLIERYCGGYVDPDKPKVFILGGPMMGASLPSDDCIVTKTVTSVIVLNAEEPKEEPCIRCGSCVLSCPAHLQPKLIMDAMKSMPVDKELIKSLHPLSCVECGLCTYVCTSKIRVTDYVRRAKIVAKLP